MGKKKPTPDEVRAAPSLRRPEFEPGEGTKDPLSACNVCAQPAARLDAWREHDPYDKPYMGVDALVFLGTDHEACKRALDRHPRLYSRDSGAPGAFPLLCGACARKKPGELACTHPDLRTNGGDGLKVTGSRFGGGMIVCIRGAGGKNFREPTVFDKCDGKTPVAAVLP